MARVSSRTAAVLGSVLRTFYGQNTRSVERSGEPYPVLDGSWNVFENPGRTAAVLSVPNRSVVEGNDDFSYRTHYLDAWYINDTRWLRVSSIKRGYRGECVVTVYGSTKEFTGVSRQTREGELILAKGN